LVKLRLLFRKYYGRHYDLVNRYGISMINDLGYSVCRNHNPLRFPFITYHWICNKCITTGASSGAGIAYPCSKYEYTPVSSEVRVAQSLVFYEVFCR
jgi:hypothetical protein